jgi:N-methylhydantoinase A
LHLSAFTRLRRPKLARLPRPHAGLRSPERRPVYFGTVGGTLDAQIYDRTALAPGFKETGPALIEEYGSTTLVWPGDSFEIGALGEIRIHCGRG